MRKEKVSLKPLFFYYVYLLVAWGFFRLLFKLSDVTEEFWVKPLMWLIPLLGIWLNEKDKIKFFKGNLLKAFLWGLGLGVIWIGMGAIIGLGRMNNFSLSFNKTGLMDILGAGVATAIVEELVFSGYIFQKVFQAVKDLWSAVLITGVMFALIHVPIGLFVYKYNAAQLMGFLIVIGLVQAGSSLLMSRSKNVIAPMIAHFMWTVAVTIFG